MLEIIKFGDVFASDGKEYVFLAKTDELLYAGEIFDKILTKKIEDFYISESKKPSSRCESNKAFCFVTLSTEKFKNRMAHFGNSDYDVDKFFLNKIGSLESKDLKEIKDTIINGPVSGGLKQLVKDIGIVE